MASRLKGTQWPWWGSSKRQQQGPLPKEEEVDAGGAKPSSPSTIFAASATSGLGSCHRRTRKDDHGTTASCRIRAVQGRPCRTTDPPSLQTRLNYCHKKQWQQLTEGQWVILSGADEGGEQVAEALLCRIVGGDSVQSGETPQVEKKADEWKLQFNIKTTSKKKQPMTIKV
jgi:hypothetical protein